MASGQFLRRIKASAGRTILVLAAMAVLSACEDGSEDGSEGGGEDECWFLLLTGLDPYSCFSASSASLPSPAPTAPGQQNPSVTSVLPVDGAQLYLNTFVQVEFSERVDVTTVVMSVVRHGLLDFSDAFTETGFWALDCHNTGKFCRTCDAAASRVSAGKARSA